MLLVYVIHFFYLSVFFFLFNSTSSYTSSISCHIYLIFWEGDSHWHLQFINIWNQRGIYVLCKNCDNRGNRIILPHTTWKAFIERRANVERLVQSTVSSSLTIQDLIVELVKIGNKYNVKCNHCMVRACTKNHSFYVCIWTLCRTCILWTVSIYSQC